MQVEQIPSGRWRAVIYVPGGQRHRTRAVPTKEEARLLGAELMLDLGRSTPAAIATVDDLLDEHLVTAKLAPTARADYRAVVAKLRATDPRPGVLDARIRDVETVHVRALYRRLERDGWSDHRLVRLHTILSGAFSRAVAEHGWIRANPCTRAGPDTPEPPEISPPADAEVTRLITAAAAIDDIEYVPGAGRPRAEGSGATLALAIRIAATVGARRGEICALQWGDITGDRLKIHRALSYTPSDGVIVGDIKTRRKGRRTVTIQSPALLAALKAHRTRQKATALERRLPSPVWIMSSDAGVSPWRPDHLGELVSTLAADQGVDCTIHDLRHYCATTLLMAGVAPYVVAGMLGHASVTTTLRRYAHWIPGIDEAAAGIMASRLG